MNYAIAELGEHLHGALQGLVALRDKYDEAISAIQKCKDKGLLEPAGSVTFSATRDGLVVMNSRHGVETQRCNPVE